jgi:hypothetical protein
VEATEPNIVQKAYQDLEARQAEADALNRGQAPVTGTFRTMQDYRGAERPGEAPVTGVGLAKPEPVGLTGRDFGAFFSSDVRARKIEFTIDKNPAAVWVRKLGPSDYNTLIGLLAGLAESMKTSAAGIPDLGRVTEMNRFLISRSLVRAELWRRKDTGEEEDAAPEWETFELPADPAERIAFLEEQVECSPDVWQPLVQECLQEQGLGQNQGNSTPR